MAFLAIHALTLDRPIAVSKNKPLVQRILLANFHIYHGTRLQVLWGRRHREQEGISWAPSVVRSLRNRWRGVGEELSSNSWACLIHIKVPRSKARKISEE